jgi:(hydroxyamino)benzene mutase
MFQTTIAVGLLKSGSIFLATGFFWGVFIPKTPYPRIALSLHLNMIQHGLLSLAAGLILRDHGLVSLSVWQVGLIGFAHFYLWVMDGVSLCNTWWGTNKTLTLVCS